MCVYAKKCSVVEIVSTIGGRTHKMFASVYKDEEMLYLDDYKEKNGRLPMLNKARK